MWVGAGRNLRNRWVSNVLLVLSLVLAVVLAAAEVRRRLGG